MERLNYEIEAGLVDDHWWFRGRRELFASLLKGLALPRSANILDIGSSSGTNLLLLSQEGYANVKGVDNSPEAIRFCQLRGLPPVLLGDATALPFPDQSADFVFATDVLEHLERDDLGAKEIFRVLKPGRFALVTVPAFQFLWGLQDEVSHHRRRYRLGEIKGVLTHAGFEIQTAFYFNFLLFPPILVTRLLYRVGFFRNVSNENQINTPILNAILLGIFRVDTVLARWLRPPFGVSALAIVRRPEERGE